MTFEEYVEKRKANPIYSLLLRDQNDDLGKLSIENSLRIDWIVKCTKEGTSIEKIFLDETFQKLILEMERYFYETPDVRVLMGGFKAFLLYLPVSEREHYDNQIVSFFSRTVAADYDRNEEYTVSFDHIFRFIVFWSECRPQFLIDGKHSFMSTT